MFHLLMSMLNMPNFTIDFIIPTFYTRDMITGRLKPRFDDIAYDRRVRQATISRRSGVSYQTVQSYFNNGGHLTRVGLHTLYRYLRGVGLTDAEILEMRLGDLFDIVDDGEE